MQRIAIFTLALWIGLTGSLIADDGWIGIDRVVAVGDLHGDYEGFVSVLRSAGLLDNNDNWAGGKTHLVQTGDILDRGPGSRKIMDLLMRLEKQAKAADGMVHSLVGNHEAMNAYGDLRYVTKEEFAAYLDGKPAGNPDPVHPAGYGEHRAAFGPRGVYGKWIRGNNAVIQINNTLFLHGGISPKYADTGIRKINQRVRDELADPNRLQGGIVLDQNGPLWYRGLALGEERELTSHVQKVLKNYGVERIVTSHTYSEGAVKPRFGGKVLLIDVGISRYYTGYGQVACLLMEGTKAWALHRGKKVELPSDSGADLLRYYQEAAALDPPPSPIQKIIGQLQGRLSASGGR